MPPGSPPMMNHPDYFASITPDELEQMASAILCGDLDDIVDNIQDDAARAAIQSEFDIILGIHFADETLPELEGDDPDAPFIERCDVVPLNYATVLETAVQLQAYHDRLLAHIGGARRIKVNSRKRPAPASGEQQ